MSRPRSATTRLEQAQAAIEEAQRKLAELTEKRNAALLRDDDALAIKLGNDIDTLHQAVKAHALKVQLSQEAAREEERARLLKEKSDLIARIEAKIEQRNKAMEEVAAAIKTLATASERAISLGREIVAAWSWPPHDLAPALLTPPSIVTAISHEAYRLSYHPRRYGGMDTDPLAGFMLPGSKCPRIENLELPQRTRPMADTVKAATEFAVRFLKTGKGSAAGAAVEAVQITDNTTAAPLTNDAPRTAAHDKLDVALQEMNRLSQDVTPAGEAAYRAHMEHVRRAQDEVTAEQQLGVPHAGSL
jgi:hypothetical protein